MKKILSNILALILILTTLVGCLSSCGDIEYDEAEVKAAAEKLIPLSDELNNIYWGEGIAYSSDLSTSNGYYYEADTEDLKRYGIETIEDLKKKTKEVFSDAYSEIIFSTALNSVSDEEGVYSYARYYQKYSDAFQKEPEAIMVYSKAMILLTGEVRYLTDTITVLGAEKDIVYVTVDAEVTRENEKQMKNIKVGFALCDGGWKIDTPTYLSFDEKG